MRAALLAFIALIALVAGGCDDATDPNTIGAVAPDVAPKKPVLPRVKWLDQRNETAPEVWLASREAHADLDEADPAVLALKANLDIAARRFHDPARMIANRAVQLEDMLAAEGVEEHAPALIQMLTEAAGGRDAREGFGAMCQHYFYLRKQGLDREAALSQLKQTSALETGSKPRA